MWSRHRTYIVIENLFVIDDAKSNFSSIFLNRFYEFFERPNATC